MAINGYAYISFEGPIAAGKTTLATLVATYLRSQLLLEDFNGNEFLADFYLDRDRWSLPMQLWFMSERLPVLKSIRRPISRAVVADYSSRKDRLFARLLLNGRDLRLFDRIAEALAADVAQPDLIVYLDADDGVLLERIRRRGREYENTIDRGYLDALRCAYDQDLLCKSDVNVVRFDTSALDLNSDAQMHHFYDIIAAALRLPNLLQIRQWPEES